MGYFRKSKDRERDRARMKEGVSAMTHFNDTPRSSQENFAKGMKTRAKIESQDGSIISFTARSKTNEVLNPMSLDQQHA